MACACLCIYHQPFSTDATIESVVVSSDARGRGLGRRLMEHLLAEAARFGVDCIHLTSKPRRIAANKLYRKMGFVRKETNCYVKKRGFAHDNDNDDDDGLSFMAERMTYKM